MPSKNKTSTKKKEIKINETPLPRAVFGTILKAVQGGNKIYDFGEETLADTDENGYLKDTGSNKFQGQMSGVLNPVGAAKSILKYDNLTTGQKVKYGLMGLSGLHGQDLMEKRIEWDKMAWNRDQESNPLQILNTVQYDKNIPTFAFGGQIDGNMNGDMKVDEINGERHEQGGVNVGGIVEAEEGETKAGNYIFSDRLKVDKNDVKILGVDKAYLGLTLAEVSKKIEKKLGFRKDDSIDEAEKKKQLDNLMVLQQTKQAAMVQDNLLGLEKAVPGSIAGMSEMFNPMSQQQEQGLPKAYAGTILNDGRDWKPGMDPNKYHSANVQDKAKREELLKRSNDIYTSYQSNIKGLEGIDGSVLQDYILKVDPNALPLYGNDKDLGLETMEAFNMYKDDIISKMREDGVITGDQGVVRNDTYEPWSVDMKGSGLLDNVVTNDLDSAKSSGNITNYSGIDNNKMGAGVGSGAGFGSGDDKGVNGATGFGNDKSARANNFIDQAGNLFDIGRGIYGMLKKDKPEFMVDAVQVNPAYLDPTRAIEEARTTFGSAAGGLNEAGLGIAAATAARLSLASKESNQISGITQEYANVNANIFNQANMFNAQNVNQANQLDRQERNYKEMINQQERDVSADMLSHGLKDYARTNQVHERDANAERVQNQIMKIMGTANFDWEQQPDGNYLVVTRQSGIEKKVMVNLVTNSVTEVN